MCGTTALAIYPAGIDSVNSIGPVVKLAGLPFAVTLFTVAQIVFVGLLYESTNSIFEPFLMYPCLVVEAPVATKRFVPVFSVVK